MKHKTKVQRISRAKSEQWYINFPAAVAQAMKLKKGETVQWLIDNHRRLVMIRSDAPLAVKKLRTKNSGQKIAPDQ